MITFTDIIVTVVALSTATVVLIIVLGLILAAVKDRNESKHLDQWTKKRLSQRQKNSISPPLNSPRREVPNDPSPRNGCNKPCSPGDWYFGGKCDRNGCMPQAPEPPAEFNEPRQASDSREFDEWEGWR